MARAQSARFYNLSWRYLTQAAVDHRGKARDLDGTLYFSGDGNVFDQILVAAGITAMAWALPAPGGGPSQGAAGITAMAWALRLRARTTIVAFAAKSSIFRLRITIYFNA